MYQTKQVEENLKKAKVLYLQKNGETIFILELKNRKKSYGQLLPTGKKSILFIMTDDTKNCDDVASYLEMNYPELKGAVLTIHTNQSGDISETTTGKKKEELEKLRKQSNEIDSWESPYKAIVSVMMLKEGWDVKNVTTVLGLKPFTAENKILPEQALGRGLRRMYFGRDDIDEYVSVIGTPAFMDFVESIKSEGVILEKRLMGTGSKPISPMVIEVDKENTKKDIEKLDIEIPVMTARIQREYKNLANLDVSTFGNEKVKIKIFSNKKSVTLFLRMSSQEKFIILLHLTVRLPQTIRI